jgi:hypothetical protein
MVDRTDTGKTTIAEVLYRLYNPSSGSILGTYLHCCSPPVDLNAVSGDLKGNGDCRPQEIMAARST